MLTDPFSELDTGRSKAALPVHDPARHRYRAEAVSIHPAGQRFILNQLDHQPSSGMERAVRLRAPETARCCSTQGRVGHCDIEHA